MSTSGRSKVRRLLAASVTVAAIVVPIALGAPADKDPAFGTNGVVKTDILTMTSPAGTTGSTDYINDLVRQPDGKIVAVGRSSNPGGGAGTCAPGMALTISACGGANNNWSLARYNTDGSLDTGFAIEGKAAVTLDQFNLVWGELRAVALEAGGTIIAAGDRGADLRDPGPDDNIHGAVVRFGADGTPLSYVMLPAFNDGRAQTKLEDVLIQPDGKIVVAGTRQAGGTNDGNMAIARLNADLSPDTTFGSSGDGIVTFNASTNMLDEARALALQPDGKILVTGYAMAPAGLAAVTLRLTATGARDDTFSGGVVMSAVDTFSQGKAVVLQPDGKVVVGGASDGGLTVFRYLGDGSPDETFGAGGVVKTNVGITRAGINDVVVQTNGKIAAVGNHQNINDSAEIQVVRYNPDGTLDAGFGSGGIAREFTGTWSFGNAMILQGDGNLVFGGLVQKTRGSVDSSDYVVVRYVGDDSSGTLPSAPVLAATDPASPSSSTAPSILGTADAGATVSVYTSADCAGPEAGTGTADGTGGFSIAVSVFENLTTPVSATASNASGTSPCSNRIDYVHDGIVPQAPVIAGSNPPSPSSVPTPSIYGTADEGAAVSLYTASDCTGTEAASGTSSGAFAVSVTVTADSTTTFYAAASDAAGNRSACSAGFTYVHVSAAARDAAFWEDNQDAILQLLPLSLGGYVVDTGTKAADVLEATSCSGGRAASCLARQLFVTKLNLASGADSCISTAVADADALLIVVGYVGAGSSYALSRQQRARALSLKDALDAYNNNEGCSA